MIKELKKNNFDIKTIIGFFLLIMVICGIIGFLYETIYFFIKEGHFVKRGTTYGPWIPIYAYGALINLLLLYKFKDNKIIMFISSSLLSGTLECIVGFFIHKFGHKRIWNYKKQFLNIGGYTCIKSIVLFGIGSLFLVYFLVPKVIKFIKKLDKKLFFLISYIPGILFIIDFIVSNIVK